MRCAVSKLSKSGILGIGIAGLVLLLGSRPAGAGPPNPTPSDTHGNTAGGTFALLNNTTGVYNTAFGQGALYSNAAGNSNTAIGLNALINNAGDYNTAIGVLALPNNRGNNNTGTGFGALYSNTIGLNNTASGVNALYSNTTGPNNTASGAFALLGNTVGDGNTAFGASALAGNTTGNNNVGIGVDALGFNSAGDYNTSLGNGAGLGNDGIGNTFLGYTADTDYRGVYTNGTALGYQSQLFASNSIVLGNSSISKIYANVTTITAISDRRRKKDIKALDADLGLDFIENLKPVSYRFNNGEETERYGFIAQDLEQALPASLRDAIERSEPEHGLALIERQKDEDRTYRVSYGELTAPIVKAIQQQQQQIEAERQQNANLRHALETVENQVAALQAQNDALRRSIEGLRAHGSPGSSDGLQALIRHVAQ